jgi:hypothetical protein
MKRCSRSLQLGKCKLKSLQKLRRLKILRVGINILEQVKFLFIVLWNLKWYNHFRKQFHKELHRCLPNYSV